MSQVVLATSIAPFNVAHQKSAIRTWTDLGFRVLSLNIEAEIEVLRMDFPEVKFVPAKRTGKEIAGRPFVFFDDILQALSEIGAEICGIVNSDIHLYAESDFASFVATEAKDAFLFGSRIDVTEITSAQGQENRWGFDIFFFPREFTQLYPKSQFCLGVPWWDYWAPLVPSLLGRSVKLLCAEVALHQLHETNWSLELYEKMGDHCLDLLGTPEQGRTPCRLLEAFTILSHLLSGSKKVHYPGESSKPSIVTPLQDLPTTLELRQFFDKVQGLSQPSVDRKSLERKLETLQSSMSWRMTQPLRWLKRQWRRS